jgi:transposase
MDTDKRRDKEVKLKYGVYRMLTHMKLESGCFSLPAFDEESHTYRSSWQELMMMVQGLSANEKVKSGKANKRWAKP